MKVTQDLQIYRLIHIADGRDTRTLSGLNVRWRIAYQRTPSRVDARFANSTANEMG